ncbi:F0F1 ATP synthase subunit delta [Actomonas aquatica]|uniref:F0F1 ATP synthase subunit delta n=1 Tax=Actomonas aquatica TaxID=2866162 RepID=A0ABZ1C718_9BACT|nr:F0F1 ATP synthase subunit delta [Opitutus sp. WL0086]WRQ86115.1 F0F1 ATP synthase subunit delta [Opitutus sp. WL0086]
MATSKQTTELAKQLTQLSLGSDGAVDPERVAGVLAYLEKHPPAQPLAVLKIYHRRIAQELAKTNAVVEHAGDVSESVLGAIGGALTQKYKRHVSATAKRNDDLIAGLRVRIGDDVYESTVAGQLDALAASV